VFDYRAPHTYITIFQAVLTFIIVATKQNGALFWFNNRKDQIMQVIKEISATSMLNGGGSVGEVHIKF
jgi:hypothetical protein